MSGEPCPVSRNASTAVSADAARSMLSIILVSLDMTAAKGRDYRSFLRRSRSKSAAQFSRAKSGGSGSSGRSQLVRLKTFLKRFSCADRATNSSFGLGHALVALARAKPVGGGDQLGCSPAS